MRKSIGSFVWFTAVLLIGAATTTFIWGFESDGGGAALPESSPEPAGYALAIGLNKVDSTHYAGTVNELLGCEPDAIDMNDIAISQGLKAEMLLGEEATRNNVLNKLDAMAKILRPGDLLVVSYSGHGANIPDKNKDEADGLDETWCLYDAQLLDDELYGAWMKFQEGVRILVFSDSCHSGTILRMNIRDVENPSPSRTNELKMMWELERVPSKQERMKMLSLPEMRKSIRARPYLRKRIERLQPVAPRTRIYIPSQPVEPEAEQIFVSRSVSPLVWMKTYEKNKSFYDKLGEAAPMENTGQVKAAVILISACEDNQTALDTGFNGLFTWKLKKVWNNGAFKGDHRTFYLNIRELVRQDRPKQVPDFSSIDAFIEQRPFTVK